MSFHYLNLKRSGTWGWTETKLSSFAVSTVDIHFEKFFHSYCRSKQNICISKECVTSSKKFWSAKPIPWIKKCHRIRGLSLAFMFCQWEGTEFVDSQAWWQPHLSLCVTCFSLCKQPVQTQLTYQSFSITSPFPQAKLLISSLYFYELEKHEIITEPSMFMLQ